MLGLLRCRGTASGNRLEIAKSACDTEVKDDPAQDEIDVKQARFDHNLPVSTCTSSLQLVLHKSCTSVLGQAYCYTG